MEEKIMNYPNPEILVSTQWLAEHGDEPDVVIVDCPWEYYSYTRAHIPGAVCRPGHAYVKSIDQDGNQSLFVANESEFEKLLAELGIGANSTVVLYDEWGSIFASRLWWVLRYYGFQNAKILDGGWQNWVSSGLPISFINSKPGEVEDPVSLTPRPDRMITQDQLIKQYKDQEVQILDVRSEDEYFGRAAHGNKRVGHIPGASHLEWNLFLENSNDSEGVRKFRSADEIKSILSKADVDGNRNIVTHCQAAVRATFVAFALELMGYTPARVYDGSMAEWANMDDTPLE
ncbi:MAG: sulfurtransferase [Deltaproteobacteria bacterium]